MRSRKVNNNYVLRMLIAFSALVALAGCAARDQSAGVLAAGAQSNGVAASPAADEPVTYGLVAREDLRVKPVGSDREVVIPEGTPLAVLESKSNGQNEDSTLVHLALNVDRESKLPHEMWVPLDNTLMLTLVAKDEQSEE